MAKLTKKRLLVDNVAGIPVGEKFVWVNRRGVYSGVLSPVPVPNNDMTKKEENVSASVGLLVLLIVFLLGNLLGHWISNKLREPTWHSPKGCPLFVQTNKWN